MTEPIKNWKNEANRLFGYKILGNDNHEAIARLLEDIDNHLLDDGPVELKVVINRGSIHLSPLTAIGEDLDRIGSLLRPHAVERADGETDESFRDRVLAHHRTLHPKRWDFDYLNDQEMLAKDGRFVEYADYLTMLNIKDAEIQRLKESK